MIPLKKISVNIDRETAEQVRQRGELDGLTLTTQIEWVLRKWLRGELILAGSQPAPPAAMILTTAAPSPPPAPLAMRPPVAPPAPPDDAADFQPAKSTEKKPRKTVKYATPEDPAIPPILDRQDFRESWARWLAFRREDKRKPVTAKGAEQQLDQLSTCTNVPTAIAVINASIANDWQGLFPDKIEPVMDLSGPDLSTPEGMKELLGEERFEMLVEDEKNMEANIKRREKITRMKKDELDQVLGPDTEPDQGDWRQS